VAAARAVATEVELVVARAAAPAAVSLEEARAVEVVEAQVEAQAVAPRAAVREVAALQRPR
jgi:hypothetical protein